MGAFLERLGMLAGEQTATDISLSDIGWPDSDGRGSDIVEERCQEMDPELVELGDGHQVGCLKLQTR